ncbi:MAG TPA: hypothetical protein VGL72_24515 [Bryobacteraceae bacterium]|jgi:hypothetical protein
MLSEKQLEANRNNARKSTGPQTEAGKQRSSLNALRHGLTGHVVALPEEDQEARLQFTTRLVDSLNVEGDHELTLAQTYAAAMWGVQRAQAIQDNMFTLGLMEQVGENLNIEHPEIHNAVSNAKTFRQESEAFSRISLYAQRLVNQAKSLLKQLEDTQAKRLELQAAKMEDAVRIYRYHQMMNEPFDPAPNGFVFSPDQIRQATHRQTLDAHARKAEYFKFDRQKFDKAAVMSVA